MFGSSFLTNQLKNSFQIIDYTQRDAAGAYECIVHEPHGDYPLVSTEIIVVGKKIAQSNSRSPKA